MPYVDFVLSAPKTILSCGDIGASGCRMSFTAHLANVHHQHVDLTTEEGGLQHLEGAVTFEPRSVPAWMGFEHGSLSYWRSTGDVISSTPPRYLITVRLEESDFSRLMSAVIAGVKLLDLSVSANQIEYDWEPDGSGMKWDNASHPRIEIGGYQITLAH